MLNKILDYFVQIIVGGVTIVGILYILTLIYLILKGE